jgi:poly-gamma-glutamate capsule biosynthesis protein CapA/YwtB (metallophosphatase superfamily)
MTYNSAKPTPNHRIWLVLILGLGLLLWSGCAPVTAMPTATPTRTRQPTMTPTPSSTPLPPATLTPTPSPTPAFPVSVGCTGPIPADACGRLQALVNQDPTHFVWAGSGEAQLYLSSQPVIGETVAGSWTYAVAAPFFTVTDDVSLADLQATWTGSPSGPFQTHPLMATTDTVEVLTGLLGAPAAGAVRQVAEEQLLAEAEAQNGWALVPFHALTPEWKVMRLDDFWLMDRTGTLDAYPLRVSLHFGSEARPEVLGLLEVTPQLLTNRDESQMTRVVMTGVTAMTRSMGRLMDRMGVTYPARDIQHWFEDADFVHISNEVSFKPDCVAEGSGSMSFCSHDSYIELLEVINANIIELTGNHLVDKGAQWLLHSLDMYRERGWRWFGGGANRLEGSLPITLTHNGNQIAFIGCNTVGPFAGETHPGATRCNWPELLEAISRLREEGYQTIATLQYLEDYSYSPTAVQMRDFRSLATAGATMVQGSQAHQPQTMEFYEDAFVHYGLGNFFFDQMWSDGVRQGFVDHLTFYEGRLLNVDLYTLIIEEYGRPRPMTAGDPDRAADRPAFLKMIFDLRPR